MAKNVVKSHFSFARNFILVENIAFRSSPLLVAAERCTQELTTNKQDMNYFKIVFIILLTSMNCFAQTEYKTAQNLIFKVGDTLEIGQPMGISLSVGHWKTIFTKKGKELTNNNLINKRTIIKKIEEVSGVTRFYFHIYGTDFYVNIDEAIAKGEIINPYDKSKISAEESKSTKDLDKYDKLKKIKDLYDSGALTKEEFESEKAKILSVEN